MTATVTRVPFTAQQRRLATGMVMAVVLVAFEVTSVITALPTITDELGGDSLYGVTLAIYTLANLVALVTTGEVSDRRGPALPFALCIATLIAGLVVAAFAPSMTWVVIGRALQGAGTGGFAPIAYALVKRAFPTDRQPMMYAYLSAGWVLPSLFAPALAGWVTDAFGWEWVFLGIIPFALIVAALALGPMSRFTPQFATRDPDVKVRSRVPTAVLAAIGIGLFVSGMRFENVVVAFTATAIGALLAVPALRQLFPAGLVTAQVGFPAIVACRMLATATFLGADSFIPLAADRIHGQPPLVQGFVIIGAALSWTGGQWVRAKRPPENAGTAIRTGFLVMLLGLALTAPVLWSGWSMVATFIGWSVGGFGMGLLWNPSTVAAMSHAGEGREGEVGSQVSLADSVGFSLMGGIGGATVALADRTSWSLAGALGTNFALAAVLAVMGAAIAPRATSAVSRR